MTIKKKLVCLLLVLPLFVITACQSLDVVGSGAKSSFDALSKAMPDGVTPEDAIGGYALTSPDASARFLWSRDFSKSPVYDAWLETDILPFVEAGLDTAKLPEGMVHEGLLVVGADVGSQAPGYTGEATPQKAFEQFVTYARDSIGYHDALAHYGISLGGGHMFEWAKDIKANDKDIVFVLDPAPFMAAGADPAKIPGWVFAKVDTMDDSGKKVQVDKLLKPFNIQ